MAILGEASQKFLTNGTLACACLKRGGPVEIPEKKGPEQKPFGGAQALQLEYTFRRSYLD